LKIGVPQEPIQAVEIVLPVSNAAFLTKSEMTLEARASPTDAVDYFAWDFGDGFQPKQTKKVKVTHKFASAGR
jgi:PKD repeat protein